MEKQKHILIVEDEEDHYELINRSFNSGVSSSATYLLERAVTLNEARAKLSQKTYDLIVSDWRLPDGDGIELIKKAEDEDALFPVIIMTSHGNETWAVEAMRLGAIDYIVKSPEMLSEMARIAARCLREWKGRVERRLLEAQLRQAKKMESVGMMAGGIAHDFNNILTAIIGYGHLLKMQVKDSEIAIKYAEQILQSAERAAALTRQLLAFSRKQILSPKLTDLNRLISDMEKLLSRIIGEDIEMTTYYAKHHLHVMVDAHQIEQVLLNLCANARDAMRRGGKLIIRTGCVAVGADESLKRGFEKHGSFAYFTVEDNGIGMDKETLDMIFEPFFTTKELGRGTGLGLSIVYGIIKQHSGEIEVTSEHGRGTTFRICLPLVKGEDASVKNETSLPVQGGSETILLAEDDEPVRTIVKTILEGAGYRVVTAVDGEDALNKFKDYHGSVDILLTDLVMPKKGGKELINDIRKINPAVKSIFMTGYRAETLIKEQMIEDENCIIIKPIMPNDLLRKIRLTIDSN